MVSKPPKIHTAKTIPGEPTALTIVFGTRKIPLPMTVPMTIATAAHSPSSAFSDGLVWVATLAKGFLHARKDAARKQSGRERHRRPDQHVPGECDMGTELDIYHDGQTSHHTDHGGDFAVAPG